MRRTLSGAVVLLIAAAFDSATRAQEPESGGVFGELPVHETLTPAQWRRIDRGVDEGLRFLASEQAPDGSFASAVSGQPAVTSLGVMAFLSRGHRPGAGPYGETLDRAVDFVLECQESSGLLCLDKLPFNPNGRMEHNRRPHTATYNHAIAGLMLGEVYGQGNERLNEKLKPALEQAIEWARQHQLRPMRYDTDQGGWRYLHPGERGKASSDLSASGWFMMFYRSAKNAEFDVPAEYVQDGVAFVERCYDENSGGFLYGPHHRDRMVTRGMTGAGLLVLTLAGERDKRVARTAGQWILDHPFDRYNSWVGGHDRFHYGAYYCSQAMYLLGGDYWARFYPTLADTLIAGQRSDGGWDYEQRNQDAMFGRTYTTSLSVLALTPPYQLLPIYQR